MAIEIKEDHMGRGGVNAGAGDNSDTRSWWVKTDDRAVSKSEIEAAGWASGDFPRPLLDSYPGNSFMVCKSLETRQQDDKGAYVWRVTARYDTKPLSKEDKERQEQPDPLLRSAVYSGGFERDQQAKTRDVNGDAIINSAGDQFIEPITVPLTRQRIKGRQNVPPDAIPAWFYDLKDKINKDPVQRGRVFEAHTLLFIPGEVTEPQQENDVEYVTIHWDLEFRAETWKEKRIDNGFNQLVYNVDTGVNDLKVPIEIDGARPAEPQLLKDGAALTKAQIEAGEFDVLEWDTIEEADFDVLP